ncbi:NAD(P)H-binding protein [uncultured Cohaesibacter sp.]|uniref:NAD(P)H-binding protein n=1 Tax=uncultured Cohaesibacter sp. TaxID=1002546 RepID=UPI00292DBA90|nr:NAD(P)H-binding protein [uncultured Cohaesibacter sp.]
MVKTLILGAAGQIARVTTDLFLETTNLQLVLYARNAASRLKPYANEPRVSLVDGDVTDGVKLEAAMAGVDGVYANLSGDMVEQARTIINAMHNAKVKRLIFVSSMGIYDEVPGQRYSGILDPYRDSALAIEASDLDYTIIRPEWLNDLDEIAYGTTRKGEPFKNPQAYVSRKSVADLIVKCTTVPGFGIGESLGVHKV